MAEESNDIGTIDEKPEQEEEPKPEEEEVCAVSEPKEEQKRIKIREVAKEKAECQDCKKTMCMKTLRYSHPEKCEGKPSNVLKKPVRKNNVKPKINVEPLAPENNSVASPQYQEQRLPPSMPTVPNVPSVPSVPQQQPLNPYANLTQQQLLQLQMNTMNAEIMRRRQEKSANMCKAMFQSRSKKSK